MLRRQRFMGDVKKTKTDVKTRTVIFLARHSFSVTHCPSVFAFFILRVGFTLKDFPRFSFRKIKRGGKKKNVYTLQETTHLNQGRRRTHGVLSQLHEFYFTTGEKKILTRRGQSECVKRHKNTTRGPLTGKTTTGDGWRV